MLAHDDSLLPLWNEFAEALSQLSTYAHWGFLPKFKIQLSTDDLSILELAYKQLLSINWYVSIMGPAVIESALWHGSWRSTPSVTTVSDFMLHWSSQTAWQLILMFLDLGRNLFNDDNAQI